MYRRVYRCQQLFAGEGSVSLIEKAPKHLKFTNTSTDPVKVTILAGGGPSHDSVSNV